jgi:TPR repeat protein
MVVARAWYEKAAAAGNEEARKRLARLPGAGSKK